MSHLRILLYMVILFLSACKQNPRSVERGEVVNVYTACYLPSDEQLFRSFEKSTGIKVNIFYDNSSNLLNKLQQQGTQPEADLLMLKGICYLQQARNNDLLQESSQNLETSPTQQLDSVRDWYPLTYDPLVIAYLQDTSMAQPPASYAELAKAAWQGKLLFPDNLDLLHDLAAAMLVNNGEEVTLAWLKQCRDNIASTGIIPHAFERMVNGPASIALMPASEFITVSKPSNIKITIPDQAGEGTYALIKGVSLVRHAPHPAYAERLLSFLMNTAIQSIYAQAHREYPASTEAQLSPSWQALGQFQIDINAISTSIQYCNDAELLLQKADF